MGFEFDAGTIRSLGTLVVAIAFIGLSLWVFSKRPINHTWQKTDVGF